MKYREFMEAVAVPMPFSVDLNEVRAWCTENMVDNTIWEIRSNAHSYIIFVPREHAMWFRLRWSNGS